VSLDPYEKTVSIPIRIVDGQVAYLYGGKLPKLHEGSIGDLRVPASAVLEANVLERLQKESTVEVLHANANVLLGMRTGGIPDKLRQSIVYPNKLFPPINCNFIEVQLKETLYLRLRGSKQATLEPCRCFIPALNREARSLNHAYTLISEVFEPDRLSHTGNIFQRGYYSEGEQWRPLDSLRRHYEAKFEDRLRPRD
jgi:hypothetical protein